MQGVITGRHLAGHFLLIWREYGVRCLLRCAVSVALHRNQTFLDLAFNSRR